MLLNQLPPAKEYQQPDFAMFGIKYCEWIIDVIQDGIELIKLVIELVRLGIENELGIEAS